MNLIKSYQLLIAVLLSIGISASNVRSNTHRALQALPTIAGFQPSTDVTDVSRIDRDQRALESLNGQLNSAGFTDGRKVYLNGGNSASFAVLTLSTGLAATIPVGTVITGVNSAAATISGVAYEAALSGATTLKFRYNVGATILPCYVGGLKTTDTTGCLTASGNVLVGGSTSIGYSYNIATGNQNGRTMKSLISEFNTKLRLNENASNPYYPFFQKFVGYYGSNDYLDKIVEAAYNKMSVTLNGRVYDYSAYDFEPMAEMIKKSINFMLYPMYVVRHLEYALEQCNAQRKVESLRSLDEAVAFYVGSQEGSSVSGTGNLMLAAAQRRCGGFKTCGASGSDTTGTAKVNLEVLANFTQMKSKLDSGDCAAAKTNTGDITSTMFVPLIQGALRYAYLQSPPGTAKTPKAEAEGAAFVMSVLPIVASCNGAAASVLYEELKPNSGNTANFAAVKAAFEATYPCMGIICSDVGGLWDNTISMYFGGAEPCIDKPVTRAPTRAPAAPVAPGTPTLPPATSSPETFSPVTGAPFISPRRGFFRRLLDFIRGLFGF